MGINEELAAFRAKYGKLRALAGKILRRSNNPELSENVQVLMDFMDGQVNELNKALPQAVAEMQDSIARTTADVEAATAKRDELARYGLSVDDANMMVMTAVGGDNQSTTVEGRERYGINVRYARDFREALDTLGRALVATPTGAQVPLAQLARLEFAMGPSFVRSEAGRLVGFVFVDVAGRNAAQVIDDRVGAEDVIYSFGIANPGAVVLHNFPRALCDLTKEVGGTGERLRVDLAAIDDVLGLVEGTQAIRGARPGGHEDDKQGQDQAAHAHSTPASSASSWASSTRRSARRTDARAARRTTKRR